MARSNKYTSLNFNGVFEKKLNNNSSQPATNPTQRPVLSNSRIHGHMLVLTRPAPKPISVPQRPDSSDKASPVSAKDQEARQDLEPDSISLRPKGRTGSGPGPVVTTSPLPSPSPVKSDRFVPPHLRPGFVGREEKPGPEGGPGGFKVKPEVKGSGPVQVPGPGLIEGRPRSGGGGYEPSRGAVVDRPGSSQF